MPAAGQRLLSWTGCMSSCATTPLSSAPTVYAHTFNTPGTYNYLCRAHRGQAMVATIVVNPPE